VQVPPNDYVEPLALQISLANQQGCQRAGHGGHCHEKVLPQVWYQPVALPQAEVDDQTDLKRAAEQSLWQGWMSNRWPSANVFHALHADMVKCLI
jgi:hypothetical protein